MAGVVQLSTEYTQPTLNHLIVGQAMSQSLDKQTKKGSDGEVMVKLLGSDGK